MSARVEEKREEELQFIWARKMYGVGVEVLKSVHVGNRGFLCSFILL